MQSDQWRRLCINAVVIACSAMLYFTNWHLPSFWLSPAQRIFFFNETDSVPSGLYIRVPAWTLRDGDYTVFEPNAQVKMLATARGWLRPEEPFLKIVGAMPGESYMTDNNTLQFWANGKYIGQVISQDRDHRYMPMQLGKYIVPPSEFLPIGMNPRSFDGRYTGTVPQKNIYAKVFPVITW